MLIVNDLPIITSIETILNELNLELKLGGKESLHFTKRVNNYKQLHCPFHTDRTASAGVSLEHGHFSCFSCGRKYSLARLISILLFDSDFALNGEQWLIKNFADYILDNREEVLTKPCRKKDTIITPKYVPDSILASYAYIHPYITIKRGISPNIIELFDVGYDDSFQLSENGNKIECITFPIKNVQGNCLFIARRAINSKLYHYLSGVEKPLYGVHELAITNSFNDVLYITESIINCLSLWSCGFRAIALNGIGNDKQYGMIKGLPNRRIVMALDTGDNAGKLGVNKMYKALCKDKILSWLLLPDKTDINDLYLQDKGNFINNIKNMEKRR